MLTHTAHINVRYAETDGMGVVYHANYLPWFEVARTELLKKHDLPYRDLEAQGYFIPVLEASLKYHRPAKYDDNLSVRATISEKPSLRIRIEYEIHRGEERLVTGHTLHTFIDRTGRPVRPPEAFAQKMRQLFPAE